MDVLTEADALARKLHEEGVNTIFCITGAGNLAIVDALSRFGKFQIIYSHHEQAAVMEAQGYSRVTGKLAVALVTTGGGAANALTGVLSAHLDSVPVLIIAGNESSFHCEEMIDFRAFGVQGFDSAGVFEKVAKWSVRLSGREDLPALIGQLMDVARDSRPGPVFLEFPMDLQRRPIPFRTAPNPESERVKKPNNNVRLELEEFVERCAQSLISSANPFLYIGNGARSPGTLTCVQDMIERHRIPFAQSWSAIDLIPSDHPLNMGRIGIYGDRAANIILQRSDFFLSIGSRLAIPQVGYDKNDFGRRARKWVVDIDPTELSKFPTENWDVCAADAGEFLLALNRKLEELSFKKKFEDWEELANSIWTRLPRLEQSDRREFESEDHVHSIDAVTAIFGHADDDAIFVTDVGAGLLSGHYAAELRQGQRMFTSQGLGEMGFGLPGAIGAHFAAPDRQVICLNTDGGIMFNLQELQLISHHKIPLKLVVFNNDGYSMIKISQDNLFAGRHEGSSSTTGVSFPNFEKLAGLFGLGYLKVNNKAGLESELRSALTNDDAMLIEILMSPQQKYYPRLATRKTPEGDLVSPPIEDLDPLIDLELLEQLLGYRPTLPSYKARGIEFE